MDLGPAEWPYLHKSDLIYPLFASSHFHENLLSPLSFCLLLSPSSLSFSFLFSHFLRRILLIPMKTGVAVWGHFSRVARVPHSCARLLMEAVTSSVLCWVVAGDKLG